MVLDINSEGSNNNFQIYMGVLLDSLKCRVKYFPNFARNTRSTSQGYAKLLKNHVLALNFYREVFCYMGQH